MIYLATVRISMNREKATIFLLLKRKGQSMIVYDKDSKKVIINQSEARDIAMFIKGHETAITRANLISTLEKVATMVAIKQNFECMGELDIGDEKEFLEALKAKIKELTNIEL